MSDDKHKTKGAGLARGPALILGAILSAFGLLLFLKAGNTPTDAFPDGAANGPEFLGFETNGWTAWFTTAAGALLLFGAAQHLLAKTMSLIVGLALGACAILAVVDGDVLGLAAANFWTWLGWGIASVLLLFNLFAPRVEHTEDDDDSGRRRTLRPRREPETDTVPPPARTTREPVAAQPRSTDGTSGATSVRRES